MLLTVEAVALLVMQPTELLQDLGVVRVSIKHSSVSILGRLILRNPLERVRDLRSRRDSRAYVFLLLVDMANLKPDVLFRQWARWVRDDVFETL